MSLYPIERYRLILRHELVAEKDGKLEVREIDEPIATEYCVDRRFGHSSIIVNEMLERLKDSVLRLLEEQT